MKVRYKKRLTVFLCFLLDRLLLLAVSLWPVWCSVVFRLISYIYCRFLSPVLCIKPFLCVSSWCRWTLQQERVMFNPRLCFAWACVSRGAAASPGQVFSPPRWSWRRAGRGGSVPSEEGKKEREKKEKRGGRKRGKKGKEVRREGREEGRESNI